VAKIPKNYFCFIDESGDHSLERIDPGYPVFVLAAVLVEVGIYYNSLCTEVNLFKYEYFDNESPLLHSRDIRKANPPFDILQNPGTRKRFMSRLTALMDTLEYEVIICAIDKNRHVENYGPSADNPYSYAVKVILERLAYPIKKRGLDKLILITESRGKKEDNELELEILRILQYGTEYRRASDFDVVSPPKFVKKENNVAGLQVADLVAYPAGRYVINPDKANKPFEVIRKKFLEGSDKYNFVILP